MPSLLKSACAPVALAPLLLLGCCTFNPYQSGYGYAPGYTVPPGSYSPYQGGPGLQGTPAPNDGTLGKPGTLNGSRLSAPRSGGPTTLNDKARSSEPGGKSGSGMFPNEKPVPKYDDAGAGRVPARPMSAIVPAKETGATPNASEPGAPKKAPTFDLNNLDDATRNPAGPGSSAAPGSAIPADSRKDDSGTEKPDNPFDNAKSLFPRDGGSAQRDVDDDVRLAGAERTASDNEPKRFRPPAGARELPVSNGPAEQTAAGKSPAGPNPYDYDKQNYTWLRGTIDFDKTTRTWQIMYSLNPQDKFGGTLTLADSPQFEQKKLRDNDVVLVEGRLDSATDGAGKPRYRIRKLFGPLVPTGQVQQSHRAATSGTKQSMANNK